MKRVSQTLAQGKPEFIDFTAAWCLTCQVNERVALRRTEVSSAFKENRIAAFKADWTDRNNSIADAIARYGRAGIPLCVFYKGRSPDPQFLPEILTPRIVLDALSAVR